jgi:hypothetical protein
LKVYEDGGGAGGRGRKKGKEEEDGRAEAMTQRGVSVVMLSRKGPGGPSTI